MTPSHPRDRTDAVVKNPLPETADDGLIIRTENLCRNFGEAVAVRNLNLEVKRGELFGLVGPDGAGKTTTLRMIAGILDATSGGIWVDGVSVVADPEAAKEHMAYMPQRFGLYQDLTVIENLIFYADLFQVPKKDRPARIERLFAFSRLAPFKDRLAGALSGGMKQKLGLACALIHSPRLLLLDEPTNGVDPVSRRDFWKILYDLLEQGISILVSTAYLDEADRTARVALMYRGTIIQLGRPKELKGLVEGITMELVPSDAARAKDLLSSYPEILDVNLFGDRLHLRLSKEMSTDSLRGKLQEQGIEIYSLKRIAPSMEDAFLSLIPKEKIAGEGS